MKNHWNTPEGRKEVKKKYFKKVYDNAPIIECACGCGAKIKSKDKYGRNKKYLVGHGGKKYDNPTQYKREWNHRNRKQRYIYKVKRSHAMKITFIKQKGNKCEKCGLIYDGTNACVFDFHHADPDKKSFNLSQTGLQNKCVKDIEQEFEKCILLCSNCHRFLHFSGW